MAKKKTRKQKIRATYHYAFPAERSFSGLDAKNTVVNQKPAVSNVMALYQYDPLYTRQDLTRTFIFTGLMIALEIGIYMMF